MVLHPFVYGGEYTGPIRTIGTFAEKGVFVVVLLRLMIMRTKLKVESATYVRGYVNDSNKFSG